MILVFEMIYLLIHPNHIVWYLSLNHISYHFHYYMDSQVLKYADNVKYIGFTFSSDQKDDNDILRQLRMLYTKSNRLSRLFHHSIQIRKTLKILFLLK